MIIKFTYKCRFCKSMFEDPGHPLIKVSSVPEVETILRDSLRQNPTAKTRVGINETHLCGTIGDIQNIGIGDLVGYRMFNPAEVQVQTPAEHVSKLLKIVKD